jgi:hypothetical protein
MEEALAQAVPLPVLVALAAVVLVDLNTTQEH